MRITTALLLSAVALSCFLASAAAKGKTNEDEAAALMKKFNKKSEFLQKKLAIANWNADSNITEKNTKIKNKLVKFATKETKAMILEVRKFDWKHFKNADLKRQMKFSSMLGSSALPEDKFNEQLEVIEKMSTIYATAKVCDFRNRTKCDLHLEPELTEILMHSRDPEELKHVWVSWRDASAKKCRNLFKKYIQLYRLEAKVNGYDDPVEYWNKDFETKTFQHDIRKLWHQLFPFYQQLHAFVRDRLNKKYGDAVVSKDGPIPAHLLGNMWAQHWANIKDVVNPFFQTNKESATDEMVKQGYTPVKMAKLAEDFFTSINLTAMPKEFWKNSILERPTDREMVCHASAWDMYNGNDFRIKMCTRITEEDLQTIHHEMGHVQYYLQYKNQPVVYRGGANSGFHEAIGDTIALSVKTDKHMHKIGLKKHSQKSKTATISDLLDTALDKITFLPFGFLIDQYRWDVLQGKIKLDDLECGWWKLREKYQGLEPPVDRSEEDFDPAAKYHVVADVPYVRYFVSFVIQFQFYKALCVEAGQYDPKAPEKHPLYECDFYGNAAAGNLLGKMLKMGGSKPWQDAMEVVTGQRNMDAGPMMEYFKPLIDWLTEENKKNNVKIGWKPSKRHFCVKKGASSSSPGKASKIESSVPLLLNAYTKNRNDESNEEVCSYKESNVFIL